MMLSLVGALLVAQPTEPAYLPAIRDAFDAELRDYPRARFRSVRAYKRDTPRGGESIEICGQVNGPNALGGYAGWTDFHVSGHWDPSGQSWFSAPELTMRIERSNVRAEAEFVDAIVANARIDAACAADSDLGQAFPIDLTAK